MDKTTVTRMTVMALFEAVIYRSPRDIWIAHDEVSAVLELPPGRLAASLDNQLRQRLIRQHGRRFCPTELLAMKATISWYADGPKNPLAFNHVCRFAELAWDNGGSATVLAWDEIVAARPEGMKAHDVDVAISLLGFHASPFRLDRNSRMLTFDKQMPFRGQDYQQRKSGQIQDMPDYLRAMMSKVEDLLLRRADGRPIETNPLDAFGARLEALGQKRFQRWWTRMVRELRCTQHQAQPTVHLVLCAALAEAALALVSARVRTTGLSMTSGHVRDPTSAKFGDLIKGATSGPEKIINTDVLRIEVETLQSRRNQYIHPGKFLIEEGVMPDARPEEGVQARAALDNLLRRILDWVETHPEVLAEP